ncbi:MAG: dynamin family protein [Clostridiales bacterium]|nr:dynamin family protein [Clostridiales bacterium]
MYDLSESIEAMGRIINELTIDEKKIAAFREQYEKISLRSRDPNFYLSTIGDFSSGKSTLINTIIGRKLLKVASVATTAVPTYIYRGKANRLIVKALCDDGKRYDITSETDVSKFEKQFGIALPQQIDEKIFLLTADKKLSLRVKEVYIELPDDELSNGLCIIDTPGINPGADYTGNHAEVTKYILNEKADAIIVLFPADQAYTQSFDAFLKDNAEYFMKDAIFVVTMMDRVDEEDREDVLRFVKANLRSSFGLKDPQVLSCSAMLSGRDPYWTENFAAFERALMDRLAQNRQRIVTERLVKLSNELLNSIQDEIQTQKSSFEQRLSVLQAHSVPNLAAVLANSEASALEELSGIRAEHDTEIQL